MEYNTGSNRASNFKSAERAARGRFEITSTITPCIVRHEVLLPINCVNNKMHETLCCFCQGRSLARCACRVTRIELISVSVSFSLLSKLSKSIVLNRLSNSKENISE